MAESKQIRSFVCIDIPDGIKERIEQLQHRLRRIDAQVSWTKASNIHLTLKFLGNVSQSSIVNVCAAIERAARVTDPFEIEVGGVGCFPSLRSPRILWIGLSRSVEELSLLQAAVENELAMIGFAREPGRFSPHLTIGRLRSPHNARLLVAEMTAAGFEPESFQAREVILMRSDLRPTGAIYTPQAIFSLGRAVQKSSRP
jgi:2'-5' RNA ligase